MLQKPEASGRLLKWAIELGQFDVNFYPRAMIKGQGLANFIAEFTYSNAAEVTRMAEVAKAVKAVGVKGRKDSVPIEGSLNSGPYMYTAPPMILCPKLA